MKRRKPATLLESSDRHSAVQSADSVELGLSDDVSLRSDANKTLTDDAIIDTIPTKSDVLSSISEIYHDISQPTEVQQTSPERKERMEIEPSSIMHIQDWSDIICFLIPVGLANFIHFTVDGALALLLPLFVINYLGKSEDIAGVLVAISGLGVLVSNPFTGALVSKTSPEFSMIAAVFVRSVSILVMAICKSFYVWCICAFIYGTSVTLILIGIVTFTSHNISSSKRGRFSTFVMGLRRLGMVVGPLYAGFMMHQSSITYALITTMCISWLGIFFVVLLMMPPKLIQNTIVVNAADDTKYGSCQYFMQSYFVVGLQRFIPHNWITNRKGMSSSPQTTTPSTTMNDDSAATDEVYSLRKVWRQYWRSLLSISVYSFGQNYVRNIRRLILTFQGDYLLLKEHEIGLVNSYSYIPDTALFFVAGYIMDRFGRKFTAMPSLLCFIASLIWLPFTTNQTQLICCAMLFGIADGIATGLILTIGADLCPFECRSQWLGFYRMFATAPAVLAPLFCGYTVKYFGIAAASISSSVVGIIAMFWIGIVIREPLQSSKQYERNKMEAAIQLSRVQSYLSQISIVDVPSESEMIAGQTRHTQLTPIHSTLTTNNIVLA